MVSPHAQTTWGQMMETKFSQSLNKFFYCQKNPQNNNNKKHRTFFWMTMSHTFVSQTAFCFIHSRELHSGESGGEAGGERHGLLHLQRRQRQRQHGRVETQLQGAPSQPVPRSQPAGKLHLGSRVSFMEVSSGQTTQLTLMLPISKNQVSQITLRPSGTQMYDLLQCTQGWTIPYSQIYVEGELSVRPVKYYTSFRNDAHPQTWTMT